MFGACTIPSQCSQWLAKQDGTTFECELDARAHGSLRCVWRSSGGRGEPAGAERELRGIVSELQSPRRTELRLDLPWPAAEGLALGERAAGDAALVVATIDDLGARTQLTLVTSFPSAALCDAWLRAGLDALGSRLMERLESFLAAG